MKIETLKTLIEDTFKNDNLMVVMPGDTIILQKKIMKVLELYENDTIQYIPTSFPIGEPDEVPYASICGCKPSRGGSGVCGCMMGNTMVPNPRKYNKNTIYSTTTQLKTNSNGKIEI